MATYENDALMSYKDANGNLYLIYPITRFENVDGLSLENLGAMPSNRIIVNPNFLDNPYFVVPVNQRKKTEYSSSGYGIDRWSASSGCNVSMLTDGVEIKNTGTSFVYFRQYFENKLLEGEYTYSLIAEDVVGTIRLYLGNGSGGAVGSTIDVKNGLTFNTIDCPADTVQRIAFTLTAGSSAKLKLIKLEVGDTQTVAHYDADGNWVLNEIPNYAEELAKCQRFFQVFRTEAERKTYCEDFRPTMRLTTSGQPALSTITVDGITYYTASAEL